MTSTPARLQSPSHAPAERLRPTLGNRNWLERHRETLRVIFPPTWTPAQDPELVVRLGITFKMLGVAWVDPQELLLAIHWLQQLGMVETHTLVGAPGRGQVLLLRRRRKD